MPVECFGTCAILRGSIEYCRICVNYLELSVWGMDLPRHPPIICKDGVPVERSDAIDAVLEREGKLDRRALARYSSVIRVRRFEVCRSEWSAHIECRSTGRTPGN